MTKIPKIFTVCAAILAAIPGLNGILGGSFSPPGFSQRFGFVATVFSYLIILVILALRKILANVKRSIIIGLTIVAAMGFIASYLFYSRYYSLTVFACETEALYVPIHKSEKLNFQINDLSRGNVCDAFKTDSVYFKTEVQNSDPGMYYTNCVLLLWYVLLCATCISAFMMIGVWLGAQRE
jgi:hypothetical protein